MNVSTPDENSKPLPKRKPPIWPWIVVLVLTLAGIYAYHQALEMIDDLSRTGRDFAQLFKWLLSLVVKE